MVPRSIAPTSSTDKVIILQDWQEDRVQEADVLGSLNVCTVSCSLKSLRVADVTYNVVISATFPSLSVGKACRVPVLGLPKVWRRTASRRDGMDNLSSPHHMAT